ncbi:helix-turn-helix transcriptional regulator, partial [Escherichia coli]
ADRNRSHWSTSKTPSYTKSVSWQHHPEPGTKWTANKVARYLYISVSTLHRRLASEGVSFQSILDDVRLNNALSAIQTTVKPISEIARENGYKCPSRFTERFHNRFKITPRELRKASRE